MTFAEKMKQKIAMGALLGVGGLIIWTYVSLHLGTEEQIQKAQRLLEIDSSLEDLENVIGKPTHEFSGSDTPGYLKSMDGFREREETKVRVYNKEGIPYWWVHIQFTEEDSKIVWYSVAKR